MTFQVTSDHVYIPDEDCQCEVESAGGSGGHHEVPVAGVKDNDVTVLLIRAVRTVRLSVTSTTNIQSFSPFNYKICFVNYNFFY